MVSHRVDGELITSIKRESMGTYVKESGVPFSIGETNITLDGDNLIATTFSDGTPIILTTARVGNMINNIAREQLRYISVLNDTFTLRYLSLHLRNCGTLGNSQPGIFRTKSFCVCVATKKTIRNYLGILLTVRFVLLPRWTSHI